MQEEILIRPFYRTLCLGLEISLCLILFTGWAIGESLEQAWEIAIHENNELKAKQQIVAAAEAGGEAARAARMPKVTNVTAYTMLSERPEYKMDLSGLAPTMQQAAQAVPALAPVIAGLPSSVSIPVCNQRDIPKTTPFSTF